MRSRLAVRRLTSTRRPISTTVSSTTTPRLTAPASRLRLTSPIPRTPPLRAATPPSTSYIQRRHFGDMFKKWFNRKKSASPSKTDELDDPKTRREFLQRTMQRGTIDSDNIFQEEVAAAPGSEAVSPAEPTAPEESTTKIASVKTRANTAMVLDPNPRAALLWHRKKVMQMVRHPDSKTPEQLIRDYEREFKHSSAFMATSVKKLVMLSRQIAGMPIDKAIEQMRWSKKKFAKEILYYLEEARDLAVAKCGMGLGQVNGDLFKQPRKILTKEGKWMSISDPTRIYVAQSWVGRGQVLRKKREAKARGHQGILITPSTKIFFVLKEEKTRLRESDDRDRKRKEKGPWIHHPNRSLIGQRPYYSW